MEDIQTKVFSDFNPPATTDGSYGGAKKNSNATKQHYNMKFAEELVKVNQRLKSSKTKVSIEATKGAIQLRATLPLKPNEAGARNQQKKQYKISLGIPANFEGLKTAEEEAYELGRLIARKIFLWTDKYLGVQATKNNSITFVEFYEQFEGRYFETRKKTIKSEHTFGRYIDVYKRYFFKDLPINESNIKNLLLEIKQPSARNRSLTVMSVVAESLNLQIDLSKLRLTYKPQKRNIPSDKEIEISVDNFEKHYSKNRLKNRDCKDNWRIYKIVYGLLAVYGLRPREIINQPDLKWFVSPQNIHNTFKVHESNKTGYREVFPFVPRWIELFDLKNVDNISVLKKYSESWNNAQQLKSRVQIISTNFLHSKIPFSPYDLRHACAIRAHLQGVPIKAAADNLGHTVEMHTRVYQRWFGLENRRKAFEKTIISVNEVDVLKDENTQLKKRIAELEGELTICKLKLKNC